MKAKILAVAVAGAAIASASALAAPGNNGKNYGQWLFSGCTSPAPSSFTAYKSTSSGTKFFRSNGDEFVLKNIGDFVNNGWTNQADNSDEVFYCDTAYSYTTNTTYDNISGVFVPHKE
jgi:hypothetical protein